MEDMRIEELIEKRDALIAELDNEDADLDAIEKEVREIKDEIERRKATETKKADIRGLVAQGEGEKIAEIPQEGRKMSNIEVRNSQEYIHAFAEYIKSGDDAECRALLTENATGGTVPVPDVVDRAIKTAWDKDEILSRIPKTNIKGNVKIGFEYAASDAVIHTEGGAAVTEESLSLGIVTMIPQTIKKWISVSDEVLDMDDGEFLEYIYSEVAYKIASKLASLVVADIIAAPATSSATAPAVPTSSATAKATASIITAEGELSDEATDIVVIATKADIAALKAAALSANYGYDPFDGLTVLSNSAASGHILVGDLKGYRLNFPNGQDVKFNYDDKTLATQDLVRIIGRMPVAHAVIAPKHFVDITLAS